MRVWQPKKDIIQNYLILHAYRIILSMSVNELTPRSMLCGYFLTKCKASLIKILTGLSIYACHALMKIIVERGTRMTFLHECRRVMRPVHGLAI